ncbi:hypothetical protein H4R24_002108 [Coemansia sp. RSA 988]|nr:hypothetical protein H4R24_002108 [Coemansia sp. RSA 988]
MDAFSEITPKVTSFVNQQPVVFFDIGDAGYQAQYQFQPLARPEVNLADLSPHTPHTSLPPPLQLALPIDITSNFQGAADNGILETLSFLGLSRLFNLPEQGQSAAIDKQHNASGILGMQQSAVDASIRSDAPASKLLWSEILGTQWPVVDNSVTLPSPQESCLSGNADFPTSYETTDTALQCHANLETGQFVGNSQTSVWDIVTAVAPQSPNTTSVSTTSIHRPHADPIPFSSKEDGGDAQAAAAGSPAASSTSPSPSTVHSDASTASAKRSRDARHTHQRVTSAASSSGRFSPEAQKALQQILHSIRNNPYPSDELIENIRVEFGLSSKQVRNWFALQRFRHMVRKEHQGTTSWRFRSETLQNS